MALRVNQNIAAMNAQRNLALTDTRLGKALERISSGLKINSAADNPSGLVISEVLRAQVSGLGVAIANTSKGVNMIKTAEGALNEVHSLLRQMRDLAVDAANNATNDDTTLAALQSQVDSAIASINQIAAATKYGSKNLLNGSAGTSATVLDTTNVASVQAVASTPEGYVDIDITTAATKARHEGTTTYSAATENVASDGTITINGYTVGTFAAATDTVQDVIDAINAMTSTTGVSARWDTDHVELNQTAWGSDQKIIYVESADILNGGSTAVASGVDAVATVTYGDGTTSTFNQGKGLRLQNSAGMTITLTEAGNSTSADPQDAIYVTQGTLTFQTGPYAGDTMSVSIGSVAAANLGTTGTVAAIDITTTAGATQALTVLDEAIDQVSAIRAELGAFQANQLESNLRSLGIARENLAASESAIRDADIAEEVVAMTREQILLQSGTAMLAQANLIPQAVLSLLR
jgi:flagellin